MITAFFLYFLLYLAYFPVVQKHLSYEKDEYFEGSSLVNYFLHSDARKSSSDSICCAHRLHQSSTFLSYVLVTLSCIAAVPLTTLHTGHHSWTMVWTKFSLTKIVVYKLSITSVHADSSRFQSCSPRRIYIPYAVLLTVHLAFLSKAATVHLHTSLAWPSVAVTTSRESCHNNFTILWHNFFFCLYYRG